MIKRKVKSGIIEYMNWKFIETLRDLEEAKTSSNENPVVIFKHSTRCGISSMALNRLERSWNDNEMKGLDTYFLDLIQHRDLSQAIAQTFQVRHESPQILLIYNESCIYHSSHMDISYQALKEQVEDFK